MRREACSHKSQPLTVSDSVGERRVYHKTVVEVNALSARITERVPINNTHSLCARASSQYLSLALSLTHTPSLTVALGLGKRDSVERESLQIRQVSRRG